VVTDSKKQPADDHVEALRRHAEHGPGLPDLQNGIGSPLAGTPSHPTERTDRVLGE
jgi:hypothetical protein